MPFTISPFVLPCGARACRVEWTGVTTGEEARAVVAHLSTGGQYYGLPLMVVTLKMESMDPEARHVFGSRNDRPATEWLAMVVANPLIRVATTFINRTSQHPRQHMFGTEAEAIEWLDARAREDAAKQGG
jgi:hypothetical protein